MRLTGRPRGRPKKITNGDDYVIQLSATSDGKQLIIARFKPQLDVYVAEFFPKGPRLGTPRRLTLDNADDLPFDWTIDDSSILFISDRTVGIISLISIASESTTPPRRRWSPVRNKRQSRG